MLGSKAVILTNSQTICPDQARELSFLSEFLPQQPSTLRSGEDIFPTFTNLLALESKCGQPLSLKGAESLAGQPHQLPAHVQNF